MNGVPKVVSYPSFSSTMTNTWWMAGRPDPDEAAEVVDEADEVVDEVGGGVVVVPDDEEPEEQPAQSSTITAMAPTAAFADRVGPAP